MRKKVLLLLAAALCMAALTTGTLAFFTDEETAHNVITSGGVNIAIVEKQAVPGMDGTTELKDFPENGITGIMPGSVYIRNRLAYFKKNLRKNRNQS